MQLYNKNVSTKLTKFLQEVDYTTLNFLENLNKNSSFTFYPALEGLTKEGESINLGFSCYALKTYFILDKLDIFEEKKINDWVNYINSFQIQDGSYVDENYIHCFENLGFKDRAKDYGKKFFNFFGKEYLINNDIILNSIRAESKQAISTLAQLDKSNKIPFSNFPSNKYQINDYFNNLNWNKPWSSGAQVAALAVFIDTQINNKEKSFELFQILNENILKINNKETGAYYLDKKPANNEIINGAMKIITGLDWMNKEIQYPEKLIDYCLKNKPSSEGCNVVDSVYVLWKCNRQIKYRENDIKDFFDDMVDLIKLHYVSSGGFTYYLNKSQIYYYGLRITKGLNTPDLHGTLLLIWTLSMINDFYDRDIKWNVLKP